MFLPPFGTNENNSLVTVRFAGLDLRDKPQPSSLSQSENLSADAYPALSPRKPRQKVIRDTGILAAAAAAYTGGTLSAFTGVKEDGFYFEGTRIHHESLSPGEKSIVDFNGKLCIFPDKLYYNYLPDPETGAISTTLESMEKTLALSGVTFYSSHDSITGAYVAYVSKSNGGFDRFLPGESITISGATQTQNNTHSIQGRTEFAATNAIVSAVVTASTSNRLDLLLYTKTGQKALFQNGTDNQSITIKVSIPDMNHVCVHNNRLWGTAANGEYLYASKLGDPTNFHSFQGLADDSWYSMIGTPGTFTGIVSYRSAVVAFKQDCIHHVYGDGPQNYSIPKQTFGGCIDGRSIAELGGVLYFLSHSGFCAYNGGEPECISPQLPIDYRFAASGCDGIRYYAAAIREDGTRDLLVYHPSYGVWHREDDTAFFQFLRFGNRLYGVTHDGIWAFGKGEESVLWSLTTQPTSYDTLHYKGVRELRLLLDAEPDTAVTVSISHDGAPFRPCATLSKSSGRKSHRIPIRFQKCDSFRIRIEGQGRAVIHALELSVYQGGKTYVI